MWLAAWIGFSIAAYLPPPDGTACALPGCNYPAVRWLTTPDGKRYPVCGSVPEPATEERP